MPGQRLKTRPAVITSARVPKSLDTAARQRRYLLTMGIRVACFIAAFIATDIWRWIFLVGAAVLPGIAVLLANAIDLRTQGAPPASSEEPAAAPQLTPGVVIQGDIER